MPPEQLMAKKPTPSSDLFSLGVVCYEALTRRKPFDGATADDVVQAILHQNPPPASEPPPELLIRQLPMMLFRQSSIKPRPPRPSSIPPPAAPLARWCKRLWP